MKLQAADVPAFPPLSSVPELMEAATDLDEWARFCAARETSAWLRPPNSICHWSCFWVMTKKGQDPRGEGFIWELEDCLIFLTSAAVLYKHNYKQLLHIKNQAGMST